MPYANTPASTPVGPTSVIATLGSTWSLTTKAASRKVLLALFWLPDYQIGFHSFWYSINHQYVSLQVLYDDHWVLWVFFVCVCLFCQTSAMLWYCICHSRCCFHTVVMFPSLDEPLLLASVQSELLLLGVHSGTLRLLSSATRPVFSLDYHWALHRVYWLSPNYQSIRWADIKDSNNKGTLIKGTAVRGTPQLSSRLCERI